MFNIGITDKLINNPRVKIGYFFKGDKLNWIIEVN